MKHIKIILNSMKEIIITYILQYLIIITLCLIYSALGYQNLTNFINKECAYILILFYLTSSIYLFKKYNHKLPKITPKTIFITISLGISISIILNMLIYKLTTTQTQRTISIPISIISSGLIGPIYEEILFRNIFLNKLKKHYNTKTSIIINTLLFALIHLNIINIIYALILGLIINIIYNKYNNILLPIILHISANTISIFLTNYNTPLLIISIILITITTYINIKKQNIHIT